MKLLTIFAILFAFTGCTKEEVQPSDVSVIPDEEETLNVTPGTSNSAFFLPQPINPSNETLVLKRLYNFISLYGTNSLVDTTVYHYNVSGEVEAEYFTNTKFGKWTSHYLNVRKYTVIHENLNSLNRPYVKIESFPGGAWQELYCDDQKRVIKDVSSTGRVISYEYDAQGRLLRVNSEKEQKVSLYSYLGKEETGLAYDYYTIKTFINGSTTPSDEMKYILSSTIKEDSSPRYSFNYGKSNAYAVEQSISNNGEVSNYNYSLDENNRISQQDYKVAQFEMWIKYLYD